MNERTGSQPSLEPTVTRVMRAGMLLSSACLVAGLVLLLFLPRTSDADALLRAGLLILMATPVVRVILAIAEAVRQRDGFWLSATVAVALILTGTLLYSLSGVS